ncbi:flagellar hook-associated protein FlgK [Paracoccus marinaquae]|uniref:Flagellar hook-associated protein 1 n=1 Tax=Paracoccus marinaquae TaxID=2841926 RepID=A0ABS6ANF9_9RHOB|nr:flagellar hook-associated protein FlgK [Paracoccus marinaquae]MBU3032029.1 flagellar hook-associated protein FlgK [Paracoccus marinaquae]
MSIARALSNAVSGLTATARGTETVAANLANVMTPGYGRREVALSAQTLGGNGGGVRIDGATRMVNATLVSEARLAASARSESSVRADFLARMTETIGLPGEEGALTTALTRFRSALQSAAARPDDELRLTSVVDAAARLAERLNQSSAAVQEARATADRAIASDVSALNAGLERVAYLNRRIAILESEGADPSSLVDERQAVIDGIGQIVPVQEVAREHGKVALFTTEGAVLLDGSQPTRLAFTAVGQMTPDLVAGTAPMMRLVQNGQELTEGQMRLFSGGSLAANFAVRDELAPQVQQELDALAFDLHERLADPAADGTLGVADPGLFTDAGGLADAASVNGLAQRLEVNAQVRPELGGDLWRIRSGIGAATAGPVGDSSLLLSLVDALGAVGASQPGSGFDGNGSLQDRFGTVEARASTRKVNAETDHAMRNSRAETISARLMADGVDSDAEMQRLLQYEQAYAANARVIQAIEEMMDNILRL